MFVAGYFNRALNQMLVATTRAVARKEPSWGRFGTFFSVLFLLETDMLTPAEQCALVVATALAVTALTNNRSCKAT